MSVPSTVVEVPLVISGSIESLDRAALVSNLRTTLECYEPDCVLTLRVTGAGQRRLLRMLQSAATSVSAVLVIPHSNAGSTSTAIAVESAASALVAQPASAISTALGVSVTSAAPISVGTAVVPIVVAPPPPSPPPLLPPTSPPPPVLPPPPPSTPDADQDSMASPPPTDASPDPASDLSPIILIAMAGGGIVLSILLVVAVCIYCTRESRRRDRATKLCTLQRIASEHATAQSKSVEKRHELEPKRPEYITTPSMQPGGAKDAGGATSAAIATPSVNAAAAAATAGSASQPQTEDFVTDRLKGLESSADTASLVA